MRDSSEETGDLPTGRQAPELANDLQRLELQRQIRNVLAVVRSIARRTADTSRSLDEYTMNFEGRLAAYSRTLAMLSHNPELGYDLEFLIAEELLSENAHDGEQVNLSGPTISLRPKPAQTLGLAIHELTTNAVKHGALAHTTGKVEVTWRLQYAGPKTVLVIDWIESGGVRLMVQPTHRGFGLVMLKETLPFELGATCSVEFRNIGFRCRLEIPVADQNFIFPASQ
jgi:two-component system CheB/CheR fusion protein